MIDDLLTPCEDAYCDDIGDIRCFVCGETYCGRHFDGHDCCVEEYGGEG